MTFGEAVEALKKCKEVKRATWNDDSSHIRLWALYDETRTALNPTPLINSNGSHIEIYKAPYCDIIAEDWMIVD